MIKAVICDFGGVLTTPLVRSFLAYQEHSGISLTELGQAMAKVTEEAGGAHPLYELERGHISEAEFLGSIERALGGKKLDGFSEKYFEHLHRNEPMIDCMRSLRDRGLRMAMLTNNVREWEPLWRAKLPEIDEIFELVVDSAFVGMRKPEPADLRAHARPAGRRRPGRRLPLHRRHRRELPHRRVARHDRGALPRQRAGAGRDRGRARRRLATFGARHSPRHQRRVLADADEQRRLALAQEVDADEVQARRGGALRRSSWSGKPSSSNAPGTSHPARVVRPEAAGEDHGAEAGQVEARRARRRRTAAARPAPGRPGRARAAVQRTKRARNSAVAGRRPRRRCRARSSAKRARPRSAPRKRPSSVTPSARSVRRWRSWPPPWPVARMLRGEPVGGLDSAADRRRRGSPSRAPTRRRRGRRCAAWPTARARTRGTPRGPPRGAPRRAGSRTGRCRRPAPRRAGARLGLR